MSKLTDEKAQAKYAAELRKDQEAEKKTIILLMSTVDGRRYIWNELVFAQVFASTDNLDPHYMAFEKGRRNTGLRLLARITSQTPEMYIRMTQENSRAKIDEEKLDGRDPDSDD